MYGDQYELCRGGREDLPNLGGEHQTTARPN